MPVISFSALSQKKAMKMPMTIAKIEMRVMIKKMIPVFATKPTPNMLTTKMMISSTTLSSLIENSGGPITRPVETLMASIAPMIYIAPLKVVAI